VLHPKCIQNPFKLQANEKRITERPRFASVKEFDRTVMVPGALGFGLSSALGALSVGKTVCTEDGFVI
jgi:hypothetical protein